MTVWESVGKSHFGDLAGTEQFLQVYAARRLNAFIDFAAGLPGCRRMTVNEGRRSRPRQTALRRAYEAYVAYLNGRGPRVPWAALAAALFFSRHDEVLHGNAADLGGPNGETINAAEQAAIRDHGPAFGIRYTGPSFGELWHVEVDESFWPAPAKTPNDHKTEAALIAAARKRDAARRLQLRKKAVLMSMLVKSKKSKLWYELHEFSYTVIPTHDEARRLVVARYDLPAVPLESKTVRAMLDRIIDRREKLVKSISGNVTDAVLAEMRAQADVEVTTADVTDADDDSE